MSDHDCLPATHLCSASAAAATSPSLDVAKAYHIRCLHNHALVTAHECPSGNPLGEASTPALAANSHAEENSLCAAASSRA